MNELYIKRVKEKLKKAMESGMLTPEQQMAAIDDTLEKLLILNDKTINESVAKFDVTNSSLEKQLVDLQKELFDSYKKAYDKLMVDL